MTTWTGKLSLSCVLNPSGLGLSEDEQTLQVKMYDVDEKSLPTAK